MIQAVYERPERRDSRAPQDVVDVGAAPTRPRGRETAGGISLTVSREPLCRGALHRTSRRRVKSVQRRLRACAPTKWPEAAGAVELA